MINVIFWWFKWLLYDLSNAKIFFHVWLNRERLLRSLKEMNSLLRHCLMLLHSFSNDCKDFLISLKPYKASYYLTKVSKRGNTESHHCYWLVIHFRGFPVVLYNIYDTRTRFCRHSCCFRPVRFTLNSNDMTVTKCVWLNDASQN